MAVKAKEFRYAIGLDRAGRVTAEWTDAPAAGRGALGSFGRSRARRYQASPQRVNFQDVAGSKKRKTS